MLDLLRGVRVLDLTTIVLGPMATQIMADLGADVIKIEAPSGDLARAAPPFGPNGIGALFQNNNRNKRSICMDLKTPAGRGVMHRLIEQADILVHNMRPAAIEALGFGPGKVRDMNPRLIYCAAVGFGSSGPYAGQPAYDDVIQAASGLAGLSTLVGREPAYSPSIVADKTTALYVVHAVLAALYHREKTGHAHQIEVPMFESMVSFILNEHLAAATFDKDGKCGYHRILSPNRKPFQTQDGWISILPYTEAQWRRLLAEIGRDDIAASEWFRQPSERSRNSGQLYGILADAVLSQPTEAWLGILSKLDIPHSPVRMLDDLLADAHLDTIGFFTPDMQDGHAVRSLRQPVTFFDGVTEPDRPAALLGQDTADILRELGYSPEDIEEMEDSGVLSPKGS